MKTQFRCRPICDTVNKTHRSINWDAPSKSDIPHNAEVIRNQLYFQVVIVPPYPKKKLWDSQSWIYMKPPSSPSHRRLSFRDLTINLAQRLMLQFYIVLHPKLLDGWETLSSSLAPHFIGNMNSPSSESLPPNHIG